MFKGRWEEEADKAEREALKAENKSLKAQVTDLNGRRMIAERNVVWFEARRNHDRALVNLIPVMLPYIKEQYPHKVDPDFSMSDTRKFDEELLIDDINARMADLEVENENYERNERLREAGLGRI